MNNPIWFYMMIEWARAHNHTHVFRTLALEEYAQFKDRSK